MHLEHDVYLLYSLNVNVFCCFFAQILLLLGAQCWWEACKNMWFTMMLPEMEESFTNKWDAKWIQLLCTTRFWIQQLPASLAEHVTVI